MVYVPIRVSTLRGDQKIGFDAYMKINDKFILYLRKGDSFEGQRLDRLRERKLRKMYILPEQENLYRNYVLLNIDMAYDVRAEKPLEMRSQVIQGFHQSQTEELLDQPVDAKLYEDSKETSLKFNDFLKNQPEALNHILNIENLDASIAHHGVNVAAMAASLAHRLKIEDKKQLQLLSVGCFLHDIEHAHSGLNINRPAESLGKEEQAIYRKHPLDGAHRAGSLQHFEKPVLNIISQHEEFIDGKGFPQGLRASSIDPLALIAGSANIADRRMAFEKIPRRDVAKNLMMSCLGQRPLEHLQILADLLKNV